MHEIMLKLFVNSHQHLFIFFFCSVLFLSRFHFTWCKLLQIVCRLLGLFLTTNLSLACSPADSACTINKQNTYHKAYNEPFTIYKKRHKAKNKRNNCTTEAPESADELVFVCLPCIAACAIANDLSERFVAMPRYKLMHNLSL